MINFLLLLLAGIVGGFMAGLLGIGGGIIYVLIFPEFLRQAGYPESAIVPLTLANSIFATLIASLSGNIAAIIQKRFYWRPVIFIGLVATVCSILSLQFVAYEDWYSYKTFNTVVIVMLVYLLITTILDARKTKMFVREKEHRYPELLPIGIFSGTTAALSGLGGGAIIIPYMKKLLKMNIKKAKSISLGVIFISSAAMTIYNFSVGSGKLSSFGLILPWIVMPVCIGVVFFAPIGVRLSKKFSSILLAYLFSAFLLVVILYKVINLY